MDFSMSLIKSEEKFKILLNHLGLKITKQKIYDGYLVEEVE